MSAPSDRSSRYNLGASEDWQALLTVFDLGSGFDFIVLLVTDDEGAEVCRAALSQRLATDGKRILELPTQPNEVLETIAEPLLDGSSDTEIGAVWVSRVVSEFDPSAAGWRKSWAIAVSRLNQFRNPFRRAWKVPVIFVGAPWLQIVLRENAPDLWSVRTTVAVVEPVPMMIETTAREIVRPEAVTGPDPEMALAEAEKLRARGAAPLAIARMLYRAGLGLIASGRWPDAKRALEDCLEFRERGGAGNLDLAETYLELGNALNLLGEYEQARQRYDSGLNLFVAENDDRGQVLCLLGLSDNALMHDKYPEAQAAAKKVLALVRPDGNNRATADALLRLGRIALESAEFPEARRKYEEALNLFHEAGDAANEVTCMLYLGQVAESLSDLAQARSWYQSALALYKRIADPYSIGHAHLRLARIAPTPADRDRHLQAARDAWQSIGRSDLIDRLNQEFAAS